MSSPVVSRVPLHFDGIPVVMHSSLAASANKATFVDKFDAVVPADALHPLLKEPRGALPMPGSYWP